MVERRALNVAEIQDARDFVRSRIQYNRACFVRAKIEGQDAKLGRIDIRRTGGRKSCHGRQRWATQDERNGNHEV